MSVKVFRYPREKVRKTNNLTTVKMSEHKTNSQPLESFVDLFLCLSVNNILKFAIGWLCTFTVCAIPTVWRGGENLYDRMMESSYRRVLLFFWPDLLSRCTFSSLSRAIVMENRGYKARIFRGNLCSNKF